MHCFVGIFLGGQIVYLFIAGISFWSSQAVHFNRAVNTGSGITELVEDLPFLITDTDKRQPLYVALGGQE